MEFLFIFIWLLPILSGMFDAGSRGLIKATNVHNFTLIGVGFLFALPVFLLWLFFAGIPEFDRQFFIAVSLHAPLLAAAMILTVEAHRRSPLSLTVPYMSLSPAFLLLATPFMALFFPDLDASAPTMFGVLGVLVITCGLYLLHTQANKKSITEPFRAFIRERGSQFILIAAILLSISATLDLVALFHSNAPSYLFIDFVFVSMIMGIVISYYVISGKEKLAIFSPKGAWKRIAFFGVFIALTGATHLFSFYYIPIVSYVISVKRSGSIIFTILLGLYLAYIRKTKGFEQERANLRYRLSGTLITIIGMLIVILFGTA